MTCTSAHSTMLISTGCSARPWLHAPTLLGRSRRCRLPLRLQPHGIRELSPVYSLEKANCCQSSVASSKFGISGGRRRLGIARIRAGRNHRSDCESDDESDAEDPVYANVDLAFSMLRQGFFQVCRAATKSARGWLPPIISTQLISFTVGGVVILTALWVLRALLEVGCVAGTFIFVAVVAIRTLWSFLSYFEEPPVNGTAPDDKGRYRPSFSQPE